jgi:hypothetical protein
MRLVRTAGAALLLLGLAGCVGISSEVPRYRVTTERPGDQVTVAGGDMVTFDITSEQGIGKAGFERVGPPPQGVTFRLRLKGLEEFSLKWGDQSVTVHYPSSGGPVPTVTPGDPLAMPVTVEAENPTAPLQDGYFVVEAPPAFIEDAPKQFRVEWIDFYR